MLTHKIRDRPLVWNRSCSGSTALGQTSKASDLLFIGCTTDQRVLLETEPCLPWAWCDGQPGLTAHTNGGHLPMLVDRWGGLVCTLTEEKYQSLCFRNHHKRKQSLLSV